jgi:hypothetical protein
MRIIRFQYKGTTRVALELEGDDRKINCLYCLQASKDGVAAVGYRSFKVPEMRDMQEVEDPQAIMEANPDFLKGVQAELQQKANSTSQPGRMVRKGGKPRTDGTNQAGRMRR